MDLTNDFAAALLEDLIGTAGITLPAMTTDSTITVAPGARQGDVDLTLTAPEPILTALAGTAIRLSAQLAATATATATRHALAFLAPAGTARFRLPPGATITGIQVPPQARGATIELPALDKPAPAAARRPGTQTLRDLAARSAGDAHRLRAVRWPPVRFRRGPPPARPGHGPAPVHHHHGHIRGLGPAPALVPRHGGGPFDTDRRPRPPGPYLAHQAGRHQARGHPGRRPAPQPGCGGRSLGRHDRHFPRRPQMSREARHATSRLGRPVDVRFPVADGDTGRLRTLRFDRVAGRPGLWPHPDTARIQVSPSFEGALANAWAWVSAQDARAGDASVRWRLLLDDGDPRASGGSAGGAAAVGLAYLLGLTQTKRALDQRTAISATVTPDGALGPVDQLPAKLTSDGGGRTGTGKDWRLLVVAAPDEAGHRGPPGQPAPGQARRRRAHRRRPHGPPPCLPPPGAERAHRRHRHRGRAHLVFRLTRRRASARRTWLRRRRAPIVWRRSRRA